MPHTAPVLAFPQAPIADLLKGFSGRRAVLGANYPGCYVVIDTGVIVESGGAHAELAELVAKSPDGNLFVGDDVYKVKHKGPTIWAFPIY